MVNDDLPVEAKCSDGGVGKCTMMELRKIVDGEGEIAPGPRPATFDCTDASDALAFFHGNLASTIAPQLGVALVASFVVTALLH